MGNRRAVLPRVPVYTRPRGRWPEACARRRTPRVYGETSAGTVEGFALFEAKGDQRIDARGAPCGDEAGADGERGEEDRCAGERDAVGWPDLIEQSGHDPRE